MRVAPELVQNHLRHSVALDLDHDAHSVAVALVAQIRNALDALFTHKLRDLFDQRSLVDLIGNLRDDQRLAILADLLHVDLGAHQNRAAPGVVGQPHAAAPEDRSARREIWRRYDLHQFLDGDVAVLHQREHSVDDFAQIVRRNIGGHADRDAAGAVDQKVRIFGWQNNRLVELA